MFASPIIDYMDYAISLGELALGYTSPNPAVGAVIVNRKAYSGGPRSEGERPRR